MKNGARSRATNFPLYLVAVAIFAPWVAIASESEKEAQLKVPQPILEQKPAFTPVERPMPSNEVAGSYQMRCWQRGQLLFTEGNLRDPTIAALRGRIVSFNENSDSATHLVEVAESLCLIKRRKGSK
ncbi:MAG: hypothetical protein WCH60_03165 [Burkholderiales bacterium]